MMLKYVKLVELLNKKIVQLNKKIDGQTGNEQLKRELIRTSGIF